MNPHKKGCPTADRHPFRVCPWHLLVPDNTTEKTCGCCYDCRLECLIEGLEERAQAFYEHFTQSTEGEK